MADFRVVDANGLEITLGSRVDAGDLSYRGVVTTISDPDGDVNDYGLAVAINPSVAVVFDDRTEDSFGTSWLAMGPGDEDAPYECGDLEVIDG